MKQACLKLGIGLSLLGSPAFADMEAVKVFLEDEIAGLSVLDRAAQEAEMQFFVDAAAPFAGMEIKVVSETLTTHEYESQVLAPAFTSITGINVTHDLIGEGDVVEKLQTQMQSGENIYDAYVNDSDLIGTHWRYQQVRNLTDWMAGEGADVTLPTLDLEDFIGTSFTTAPDGKLYQLPTQQFANLYWFRYDWFNDEKNVADFKERYGYDLGVPVNWSAYEDIAEFFTGRDLSHMGVEGDVFGNMDYGKKDPSLGWRDTDAWMSMAGMGDVGEPNGFPVDEWGIRVNENSQPVGSCVARGGATNDAAAVYAVTKAIEWLKKYSPPAAAGMTLSEAGPIPAQGNVAQQMFWDTAFTADTVKPGLPVMNEDGTPKWRMAPSPHGVYWKEGQKVGYQDVGSWTLMESTPVDRAKAAWLYAQFVVSKTVDLKKSDVGLTFIRESTIDSEHFTERAPRLGGLVEFYRSPARLAWSPTGTNVPDYPKLAQLWWQNIGDAMSGAKTPQEALDALCESQERVMERLERAGLQGDFGPVMNEPQDPEYWYAQPGSPVAKLENEDEDPQTVSYDELIKSWTDQGALPPRRYPALETSEADTSELVAPSDSSSNDYYAVRVFFGTNRKNIGSDEVPSFAGSRGRKLLLGEAIVTIPLKHKIGEIEQPYRVPIVGFQFRRASPRKHFTLQRVSLLDDVNFVAGVRSMAQKSSSGIRSAIIFVHGYNVGFDHAAFRVAQITHDLQYDGVPFFYSWPSNGETEDYEYDQQSARQARAYLKGFINKVMELDGFDELHIIAHSMGSDPLLEVLRDLNLENQGRPRILNEIILAAPDIDKDLFLELADHLDAVSENVTLYASGNDRAMAASKTYARGVPRAGGILSNGGPVMHKGVESIDASAINTEVLSINHNDYVESRLLLEDIGRIIRERTHPPHKRNATVRHVVLGDGEEYWAYPK